MITVLFLAEEVFFIYALIFYDFLLNISSSIFHTFYLSLFTFQDHECYN